MPNTLAHFGAQGPLTRVVGLTLDVKWVLAGCVLPDVPWILRRALLALPGGALDPVGLRLYAIVQASLAFTLVLAGAAALVSERPRPVFGVLSLGAILHLLVDAAQTKWGNGVHLFAPASWDLWNAGWFWPESAVTLALTVLGLAYLGWETTRDRFPPVGLRAPGRGRAVVVGALVGLYLVTPPLFFPDVLSSGSHSLDVVVDARDRTGRRAAFDHVAYHPDADPDAEGRRGMLKVTGAEFRVRGDLPRAAGTVSVRGVFVSRGTFFAEAHHRHPPGARELASAIGLVLFSVVWIRALAGKRRRGGRAGAS